MSTNQTTKIITITFSDVIENHYGMQQIGNLAKNGYTVEQLETIGKKFSSTELVDLTALLPDGQFGTPAKLLIIRNGVSQLADGFSHQDLFTELVDLKWDQKAFMYGRVVNKHARWNLCFADSAQEPDYANKKGTIVEWSKTPLLLKIKKSLEELINDPLNADPLNAEGNYYYDVKKCGIGWHGDAERKKVVAVRLGAEMNICYQWYYHGDCIGQKFETLLQPGDIYFMSEKAVGFDWKKKNILTLRHAAGSKKFTAAKK